MIELASREREQPPRVLRVDEPRPVGWSRLDQLVDADPRHSCGS